MKVIFGLGKAKLQKFLKPALTIGVFDGLHRGHLELLKETKRCARRIKGKSVVLTFYPHPQEELSIYSLTQRLVLFKKMGIDFCVVLSFTQSFSKITPEDFLKNILIKSIRPTWLIIGENFRFGKSARGKPHLLEKFSKVYGYQVKIVPRVRFQKRPVSSTWIRDLIRQGRLRTAERLLTRPVSILGTVIKGDQRGRLLGFPTANIRPHHEIIPSSGVYLAKAFLRRKVFTGLSYIGRKPTFNSPGQKSAGVSIEMYIFNLQNNLYGEDLEIQFLKKLRNDRKFSGPQQLITQIKKDISLAKVFFSLPTGHAA
jgi:riboflavin kinase/FMN adenylyltransferase